MSNNEPKKRIGFDLKEKQARYFIKGARDKRKVTSDSRRLRGNK